MASKVRNQPGYCVTKIQIIIVSQEILEKVEELERAVKAQTTYIKSLKDLNLPHSCREVVDKDADAILREIESSVLQVAYTILKGEGFTYALPNRSKANQLYVPGMLGLYSAYW
jgi:meiotic recombination protein SPO11